jgi:hypothetical protein
MDDVTRLKRAFERSLPETAATSDPYEDLARARSARRARTGRRLSAGLGALALVAAVGVGVANVLDGPEPATPAADAAPIQLVDTKLDAAPYTFDLTPKGWSVQGENPYAVTIAPDDGSTDSNPDVFVGKLVITFDHNAPAGRPLRGAAREVWVHADSGYTTVSTRTRPGEPRGVVHIQYPGDTGWQLTTMVRFLDSVHVGPGAKPGLG